jgi:hypothetical protein
MDILNRYLQAIGQHLPATTRADVLAELRANLLAQIEAQEEELNRPLSDAETAAILQAHGHPELVAERYLPQRSLIGPTLFPLYRLVLRRAFPLVLLIYTITQGIKLLSIPTGSALASTLVESVLQLFPALFFFVFWVTVVFAIIEAVQYHYAANRDAGHPWDPDAPHPAVFFARLGLGNRYGASWPWDACKDWDPTHLPPIIPPGQPKPKSFAIRLADLLVHILWFAYVLAVPTHPALLIGPGTLFMDKVGVGFAPIWHTFYILLIVLLVTQLVMKLLALAPSPHPWMEPMDLILKAFGIVVFSILIFAGVYFVPHTAIADPHQLAVINHWVGIAFRIALFFAVLDFLTHLWKYFRPRVPSTLLAF